MGNLVCLRGNARYFFTWELSYFSSAPSSRPCLPFKREGGMAPRIFHCHGPAVATATHWWDKFGKNQEHQTNAYNQLSKFKTMKDVTLSWLRISWRKNWFLENGEDFYGEKCVGGVPVLEETFGNKGTRKQCARHARGIRENWLKRKVHVGKT